MSGVSVFNAYLALSGAVDADIVRGERLSHHTTYRIGGPAALHVTCHSYQSLVKTIEVLGNEGVEWVVMGKGSNVLVSDEGFDGCVITLGRDFRRIVFGEGDASITCGAAVILATLVKETLSHALSGLEFAVGIPGTFGGALAMDAGSRRDWIGPLVKDLVVYRPGEGMHRYAGSDVEWGYRSTSIPTSEIILEATLGLASADKEQVAREMEHYLARRRSSQPMGKPTCGSVFRNPPDGSVGRMLEDCGLKGFSVGGAQVSSVHANFIVNNGNASASDVAAVMKVMHDKVRETYGVDLQPEVKFLGFSS